VTQLTQMNLTYVSLEDRLLFNFLTNDFQEYSMWFTRRLVTLLWNILDKLSNDEGDKEDLSNPEEVKDRVEERFKEEQSRQQNKLANKFMNKVTSSPFGERVLLISKLTVQHPKPEETILAFYEEQNTGLQLGLNLALIQALRRLIVEGEKKAQWGLNLEY
jgi:hypothetical protein